MEPATSQSEAKNLSVLALFLSSDIWQALQAALVTQVADTYFAQHQSLFATNPANTLPHMALSALEERSIVRIAETLKEVPRLMPVASPIRGKTDLFKHRLALSHTATIRWEKPGMQEFADSGRQWTDRRAALVWDMWRSVNERLRELGEQPAAEQVIVGPPLAVMLHGILRLSVKPDAIGAVPDEALLLTHLQKARDQFVEILLKYPDGQIVERRDPPRPI